MMTDKEIRTYLSSHKLLMQRAELRYEKIRFYEKYNAVGEYRAILAHEAESLLAERRKIERTIDALSEPSKTILRLRYIEGHTLEETADKLHYAYRWTARLQAKAINDFREAVKG